MSRAKGDIAEQRACVFLEENGFIVVDRNISSRFGDIDIIVKKEGVLHFVEVKSGEDYELAIQNITPTKLSRFIKTVDTYRKKNAYEGDFCIDVVIVTPLGIEFLENVTL